VLGSERAVLGSVRAVLGGDQLAIEGDQRGRWVSKLCRWRGGLESPLGGGDERARGRAGRRAAARIAALTTAALTSALLAQVLITALGREADERRGERAGQAADLECRDEELTLREAGRSPGFVHARAQTELRQKGLLAGAPCAISQLEIARAHCEAEEEQRAEGVRLVRGCLCYVRVQGRKGVAYQVTQQVGGGWGMPRRR